MYRDLFRKTIRGMIIGTALSVLPAIPFYIYTFEPTTRQLSLLVPLFLPALAAMIISDVVIMRWYLAPIREFYNGVGSVSSEEPQTYYLAKQRALNFPSFSVLRVFLPHAIIGSGIFNLMIIVGNATMGLGISSEDFPIYWLINLTVVPIAHAVYEYFSLGKAMQPTLEKMEPRIPALPEPYSGRVVNVRLATKVVVIFIMLGLAPLFILGISMNLKHEHLLMGREKENLLTEAHILADYLPNLSPFQQQMQLARIGSSADIALLDTSDSVSFSNDALDSPHRTRLESFVRNGKDNFLFDRSIGLLAVKVLGSDGKSVIGVATLTGPLIAQSSTLRYGTGIIISVSLMLMVGLLVLVGKDINESTQKLVGGLKEVEQGTLDHEVKIYSTDEFSVIGKGFNQMIAGLRERNFIRDTFGKYVAPKVLEKILSETGSSNGKELRLKGERRQVTILISDIRDFTSRTEQSTAEEIVDLLNGYLERMVAIVEKFDGTVDKFIGDAIMVLFGAPFAKSDDPDRALQTALAMRQELRAFNIELAKRVPKIKPLRIGIGIHTGEVVAGNIGSTDRLEYTVIGDAVNLASRIEGLTKQFRTDILISDVTVRLLRQSYSLVRLPRTTVKGKKGGVVVYHASDGVSRSGASSQKGKKTKKMS
jgi:class 3 adenylate cyclase/HAMP domain-containing protein